MFPSTLIQKRVRMIRERGAGRPSIRSRGRGLLAAVLAAIVATAAAAPDPAGRPIAERLPEAVAGAQKVVEKVRGVPFPGKVASAIPVSYTHLRAHETVLDLVCRLLL